MNDLLYRYTPNAPLERFSPDQPRDEHGRWTEVGEEGGGEGEQFVSPNVGTLDLPQALQQIESPRHKTLRNASADVDKRLAIDSKDHDIIGAWKDGAENSVMSITSGASWDGMMASAAMKGHLADQKSVLVFRDQKNGPAVLYKFDAKGEVQKIHQDLVADGLAFHTLVPHKDGATIYVADLDGSLHDAVDKGSGRYDAKVEFRHGRAEFIGTTSESGTDREQRDDARRAYEQIIEKSPVPGSQAVWKGIRDRWGEALATVKFLDLRDRQAFPNLRGSDLRGSPEHVTRALVDHAKANLRFALVLGGDGGDLVEAALLRPRAPRAARALCAEAAAELARELDCPRLRVGRLFDGLAPYAAGKVEHLWRLYRSNPHVTLEETQDKIAGLIARYAPDFEHGVFVRAHVSHDTAQKISEWVKTLGLPSGATLVDPNEYHATLIYSKTPFDYEHDTYSSIYPTSDATNKHLELLGVDEKVLALRFDSHDLTLRHDSLKEQGAVSDFPEFKPHITVAFDVPSNHDVSGHEVYNGSIKFTSESAEPIDDQKRDWDEGKHPREPAGSPTGGEFAGGEGGVAAEPVKTGPIDVAATQAKAKAGVAAAAKRDPQAAIPGSEGTHPAMIASRQPVGKNYVDQYGQPSLAAMRQHDKNYTHDVALFHDPEIYPNFRKSELKDCIP